MKVALKGWFIFFTKKMSDFIIFFVNLTSNSIEFCVDKLKAYLFES